MCFTLADEIFFAQGQKSNLNVCSPEMKKTLKCRSMLYSVVNQVAELCNWHKVKRRRKNGNQNFSEALGMPAYKKIRAFSDNGEDDSREEKESCLWYSKI